MGETANTKWINLSKKKVGSGEDYRSSVLVFSAAPYLPGKFVRLVLVFSSPKSLHVVVW